MTRLDDIKAREAAATEGPWVPWSHCSDGAGLYIPPSVGSRATRKEVAKDTTYPNAAFIANAREDVPWLVERIEAALVVYDNIASECRAAARRGDWALAADLDRARIQLAVALGVES